MLALSAVYKQIQLVARGSISIPPVPPSQYEGSETAMPDILAPYKPSPDLLARWRDEAPPGVFRVPVHWVFVGVFGGLLLLSLLLVLLWRLGFFTRRTFKSKSSSATIRRSRRTEHTGNL